MFPSPSVLVVLACADVCPASPGLLWGPPVSVSLEPPLAGDSLGQNSYVQSSTLCEGQPESHTSCSRFAAACCFVGQIASSRPPTK